MKIYFAGAENIPMLKNLIEAGAKNVLMSYYYLKESGVENIKDWLSSKGIDIGNLSIYLDCGAFTAWTQGKEIDLQSYIEFIKLNKDYLTAYSALDDKNSTEKTKENLKVMEEAGLKPVAVYHITMNDWDYLRELAQSHDYIAIGAIAGEHKDYSLVKRNLRKAVEIVKPFKTRLHIYGFTVYNFLAQVPVYSCDSTSWLDGGKLGTLMFANHSRHTIEGVSYHDKTLFRYKNKLSQMGIRYEDVVDDKGWLFRDRVNIKTFLEMNQELDKLYEERHLRYWDEPNEKVKTPNGFERNKGKIQEIIKDPEIEKKRREGNLKWVKKGLANLKTGRYSTFPLLFPDKDYALSSVGEEYDPKEYYKSIIESVQDLDVKNSDKLLEMLNDILRVDVIRAAKNLIYESADGGIQDRNLSTLLNNISNRMIAILELKRPKVDINNIIVQTAEEINNQFDEETKQQLIIAIKESLREDVDEG